MANTHLDHKSSTVQEVQVGYLLNQLKTVLGDKFTNCTVYLTGDFNYNDTSVPYAMLLENGGFTDAHIAAQKDNSKVNGTYHAYGTTESEIDFCFFKGEDEVLEYEIISKSYVSESETEPGFVSDHYGVLVTFDKEVKISEFQKSIRTYIVSALSEQ